MIPGGGRVFFYIPKCQDQQWAHRALCSVGKRGFSLTVKGPGYVADCLHASGVEVKNGPAISLLPYALMGCTGASLPLLYSALIVDCIVNDERYPLDATIYLLL